jgi:hypothetical protein
MLSAPVGLGLLSWGGPIGIRLQGCEQQPLQRAAEVRRTAKSMVYAVIIYTPMTMTTKYVCSMPRKGARYRLSAAAGSVRGWGLEPYLLWWAASAVAASALPFCSSRRSKQGSTGWLSGIAWKQGYAPWPGAPPHVTAPDPGVRTVRCVTPASTHVHAMTVQCSLSVSVKYAT